MSRRLSCINFTQRPLQRQLGSTVEASRRKHTWMEYIYLASVGICNSPQADNKKNYVCCNYMDSVVFLALVRIYSE